MSVWDTGETGTGDASMFIAKSLQVLSFSPNLNPELARDPLSGFRLEVDC
jgi:hypothetical protein